MGGCELHADMPIHVCVYLKMSNWLVCITESSAWKY